MKTKVTFVDYIEKNEYTVVHWLKQKLPSPLNRGKGMYRCTFMKTKVALLDQIEKNEYTIVHWLKQKLPLSIK